jgi:ABC-type branched-subunit amino acid transport system substrate-binding protein
MAYDAAMVEITAIENLIHANKPVTRAAVRDQVAAISYPGASGTIAFDANGDNTHPVFSVYVVDATNPSVWRYDRQLNV